MGVFSRDGVRSYFRVEPAKAPAAPVVKEPEIVVTSPQGESMTLVAYADRMGLSYKGALWRYHEWGPGDERFWQMRRCPKDVKLGGATRPYVLKLSWLGVTKTVSEWAEYLGISVQAMWQRYKKWGICERTFRPRGGRRAAASGV